MRVLALYILCFSQLCFSQTVLRQEVFNGGVCVAGFSTGLGVGEGEVELFIEPGSTIKKTLLLAYSYGSNTEGEVRINGQSFVFDSTNLVISNEFLLSVYTPINLHAIDITGWFTSNIILNSLFETTVHPDMPFRGIFAPLIYIEYENIALPVVSSTIIINDQPIYGSNNYTVNNLNPIATINPVGFSLYSDRHSNNQFERSHVYFNNNYLGLVYGADNVNLNWGTGVKGHFFYQNNTLFGLDDDLPNNTMNATDALADVSEYVFDLSTSINFSLQQIVYPVVPNSAINSYLAYFLTYTSPCQPFPHSLLTSDTTTCPNTPLQLGASGGIAYNWLPETNLSCYDCPNPVFLGDSTINYTVRIWSTDSCSVVQPVRVRVLPAPTLEVVNNNPATCGFANGSLTALASGTTSPNTYVYTLSGGTQGLPGNFINLAPGTYTLSATDANGCTSDTTVQILEINNVQAAFSVNPSTGAAPLQVQTQNNSQNATLYDWFWVDESSTLENPNITLDTAGIYTLTLVASNGTAHCNDTTSLQIVVYDSLQVVIPNVFTPNNDGVNDFFGITSNAPVSGSLLILNRWGNVVFERNFATQAPVFEPLWNGNGATDGVYFYKIFIEEEGLEFVGNVSLWR